MTNLTTSPFNILPGTQFKIVDAELLAKWPRFKNRVMTLSICRYSGRRIFIQYNTTENGRTQCATMKLLKAPEILVVKDQSREPMSEAKTLANLCSRYRNSMDAKPMRVRLDINGAIDNYEISHEFWQQNYRNIRLKGLTKRGQGYRVPGSAIVVGVNTD